MNYLPSDIFLKICGYCLEGPEGLLKFGFISQLSGTSSHFKDMVGNSVWGWLAKQLGFDENETQYLSSMSLKEFCCAVIGWHRCPTEIKAQNCTLTEGLGRITLEGRNGKGLKLDGKTILFDFPDCIGSMGRFFLMEGTRDDCCAMEELKKFRQKINNSFIHPSVPLSLQFKSFLNLFQPGLFRIRIQHNIIFSLSGDHHDRKMNNLNNNLGYLQGYYPSGELLKTYSTEVLHFTQTPAITNPARVEYYFRQIQQGFRPLLVILTHGPYKSFNMKVKAYSNSASFLLDGHHKLCAYYKAMVLPSALRIQNLDAIEQDKALEYVQNVGQKAKMSYLSCGETNVWWNYEPMEDDAPGMALPLWIEKADLSLEGVLAHFNSVNWGPT